MDSINESEPNNRAYGIFRNNAGMSLIELIVVIAVMAILVGALAPAVIKYIERSRQSKDVKMIDNIKDSIQFALADPNVADTVEKGGSTSYYLTPRPVTDLFDSSLSCYSQELDKELRALLTVPSGANLAAIQDQFTPTSKVTMGSNGTRYKVWFYIDLDDGASVWIGTQTAAIRAKVTDQMFLNGSKDMSDNIQGWDDDGIDR